MKFKKILFRLFLITIIFLFIFVYYETKKTNSTNNFDVSFSVKFNLIELEYETYWVENVKCTFYTNTVEETDSTPNITASNRPVFDGIIALSRDFFSKDNVKFGDLVYVEEINKFFIIEDKMNARHQNSADIFTYVKDKKLLNKSLKCKIKIFKFKRR
ncbi:MAG: hypothetical protein QXK49_03695 [Candidatus Aenigmatarchaeota archaeon]